MFHSRTLTTLATAVVLAVWGGVATASTVVSCPTTVPDDRYMTFDAPGTICMASGVYSGGNKAEDQFLAIYTDGTVLGKVDEGTATGLTGTPTDLDSGLSGTITWDPTSWGTSYSAFAILFKFGNGDTADSWFAYSLPAALDAATWAVLKPDGTPYTQHELSHVTLIGLSPIPLPAAGFLLIGALGGLGLMRRRRKIS